VKVTAKSTPVKKVQIGILAREVTPGAETDQYYYKKAVDFASKCKSLDDFNKATADNDPVAIPVTGLRPLDRQLPGVDNSRNIVHWAFQNETEEGDMLKEINDYGGKYIVAILTGLNHKGYSPFEKVADDIKQELQKQKKADQIAGKLSETIANVNSIDEAATNLELPVQSATGIRFVSYSISQIGSEPKLIAAAVNAPENELTGPVSGENGVYLLQVDNRVVNENPSLNTNLTKSYIEQTYAQKANGLYQDLMELGRIKDYRYKFY
jgi:peptidyl-prolyl cis-trans isomerase D